MLAALGMFSIGYQTGTFGKRRIFDLPVLAASFAIVIILIATMDSSGRHRFKVNPQPILDLEQMMNQEIPLATF